MTSKSKILVVDDDESIVEILLYNLNKEGYETISAYDGADAIKKAKTFKPDLIILDVMMPKLDGIEVCYQLREIDEFKETLIIFSSARSEDFTKLSAFGAGADDYIEKPVKPRILISRIKAMLKRYKKSVVQNVVENTPVIKVGSLLIDHESFIVKKNDEVIPLVKKEFQLLSLLVSKLGKVFRREEIISNVWGSDVIVGDRTIDVHIRKLREKIGTDYFLTVKGVGYKYNEDKS